MKLEQLDILTEKCIKRRIRKVLDSAGVDLGEAIQCLEEFDYCFKLSEEEEKIYKDSGYLFPSLRPEGSFALGIYFVSLVCFTQFFRQRRKCENFRNSSSER